MTGRTRGAIALAWLATRVPIFMMVLGKIHNPWYFMSYDVRAYYHDWGAIFATGAFPVKDVQWQYPPGAAAMIWLPRLFGGDYAHTFYWLALAADALIMALLVFGTGRAGSSLGSWVWVAAVPMLGEIVYYRYDLLVSVFAVAAVLVMARRPAVGGALAGVGAMVKVWPALALVGAPPRRRGGLRALAGALATCLVVAAAYHFTMSNSLSFLQYQSKRGIEVESIFATPFMVMRHFGWKYDTPLRYGSIEYVGPYTGLVGNLALAATVLAFAWLVLWRWRARRWTPATVGDAALTATLLFIVISRVISPQYMVWVLALGAAALCLRGSSQRPVVVIVLAATILTQIEFPIAFGGVVPGRFWPTMVLFGRNVLLLAATLLSMWRLWRATVPGRGAAAQAVAADGAAEVTAEPAPAPAPEAEAPTAAPTKAQPAKAAKAEEGKAEGGKGQPAKAAEAPAAAPDTPPTSAAEGTALGASGHGG